MSDTMHGSLSGSLRPRQRTFTSCTECRRRKQKCNQAKDRPCSNCARRYPPPVCTYQSSSPTPPPPDHDMKFEGNDRNSHRTNQMNRASEPSDFASQHYYDDHTTTTGTESQSMYITAQGYHSATSTSRHNDRYYSGNSNSYQTTTGNSGSDFYPVTSGYYQNDHIGYSTADGSHDYSYVAAADDQQWLSSGDPDVFVGTGTAEYFYVDETEPARSTSTRH